MSEIDPSAENPERRRKFKRRAIWVLVGVLLVVALIITPPLINVNRLRLRIASKMSESLGRPVHLDSVTLNVLPVPGFTLQNLVVSEDPAFGYEPVITAASVRATVRVSSLWRRHVEFSTIRFEEPTSVNLVRRADGRWNFESILLHAAQAETAPTAQTKPGPAPRFPYIEATGARVNVKLGEEKMPLALTDAEFALWLPSPQEWRLRLQAKPARTDTFVSDTGVLTVEAALQRAARVEDVPIEMTVEWKRAPLGEASRVLTGNDAGWRGGVDATANLQGTLGDAVLGGNVRLSELRRAEFIPARPLDVDVECGGHLAVVVAVLHDPTCTFSPTPIHHFGFGAVEQLPPSAVIVTADKIELTGLKTSGVRLGTPGISVAWLMDFARLWSQRIPTTEEPKGTASGSFVRVSAPDGTPGWQGELNGTIAMRSLDDGPDGGHGDQHFTVVSDGNGLTLAPFNLTFADKTALLLSGHADTNGLALRLTGGGTRHQAMFLERMMPPLGDGLERALPKSAASDSAAMKVDLTCTRSWGGEQTCVSVREPEVVKKPGRRRR